VQDKGGTIRTGAKSIPIVYYSAKEVEDRTTGEDSTFFVLRYFRVFSLDDIDGIPAPVQEATTREFSPIEAAQRIIANMPFCPEIKYSGVKAYYSPSLDYVNLPPANLFHSDEEFYSTAFHEICHASGHSSRLNRSTVTKTAHFGSSEYSKEELIAEMGASFLNATAGIIDTTLDNSAAYIKSWLSVLKSKDNKGLIIQAASQAQKAVDFILNTPAHAEA
jgi:antirestriction protein ArdC